MAIERQSFADATTARAYLKNLASNFENPDDLSEFLGACDMAQAVLAYWLIQEISYYRMMETSYVMSNDGEADSKKDMNTVYYQYRLAFSEFEHVKQRLSGIISKLDIGSIS